MPEAYLLIVYMASVVVSTAVAHVVNRRTHDWLLVTGVAQLTTAALCVPLLRPTLDVVDLRTLAWLDSRQRLAFAVLAVFVSACAYLVVAYGKTIVSVRLDSRLSIGLSRTSVIFTFLGALALGESRDMWDVVAILVSALLPVVIELVAKHKVDAVTTLRAYALLGLVGALLASFLNLVQKVMVSSSFGFRLPPLVYVIATSTVTAVVALGARAARPRVAIQRSTIAFALTLGAINFVSFALQASYLQRGDASVIFALGAASQVFGTPLLILMGKETSSGWHYPLLLGVQLGAIVVVLA